MAFHIFQFHECTFLEMQHVLAKMKAILKSSSNSIRGFSLSCVAYSQEKSCGDESCATCQMCHLVKSFSSLVNWTGMVDGFERKSLYLNLLIPFGNFSFVFANLFLCNILF